jgi:hypothetical protein
MKKIFEKIGTTEIRNILAVLTVVGCFILLYLLQIKEIPHGNKDVVLTAIGFVFGGLLGGVAGYFFGSSKSEVDSKNNTGQQ